MNATPPGPDRAEREELGRLLPVPAERDLPPGRHLHYRNVLMRHIDEDLNTADAAGAGGTTDAGAAGATAGAGEPPADRKRRRLLRPAVLVPATAAALVGALVAGTAVVLSGHDQKTFNGPEAVAPTPSGHGGASVMLDRISDVAAKSDSTPVKDSQFVYVRSLIQANKGKFGGPVKLGAPYKDERWSSQDPTAVTNIGWMRDTGKDAPTPGEDIPIEASTPDGSNSTGAIPPGIRRPTYKWLASLPTDPKALMAYLYAKTPDENGHGAKESKDQAVFEQVGDLLNGTIMPPKTAAALYRVVARIPGVRETPDAVDAAGRHGIGITREDPAIATRDEWIFDRHSLTYLGSRSYVAEDAHGTVLPGHTPNRPAGSTAVLQRAVVDQHGMEPGSGD